jgi:hypothetical protein
MGSGARGDCKRLRWHAFSEFAAAQAVRNQVQRGLGKALLQQWRLWQVDPPPAVLEMVWLVVVFAGNWAMGRGRQRLRSYAPPRQGSAVQQVVP